MLLAVLALAGEPPNACAQTATQQREAAVLKARAGQMAEAQAALRAMLARAPTTAWSPWTSRRCCSRTASRPRPSPSSRRPANADPPDYALLAATRAYRDLRRYDEAARLAREGARRFPGESVWPLLLSLVLSDAGRTAEALEVLRTAAAQRARRSSG